MKTRESGMPAESMWSTFFEPESILRILGLTPACRDVVDFGCGYGTFTIPAARIAAGIVHAFDIDPEMVAATQAKTQATRLSSVQVHLRDFMADGTGIPENSISYAMLFNILHAQQPLTLLNEARRILQPDGLLAVTHWNHDPRTPRGPPMSIRTRPETCREWALAAGFDLAGPSQIDLPPYHYGIVFRPTNP